VKIVSGGRQKGMAFDLGDESMSYFEEREFLLDLVLLNCLYYLPLRGSPFRESGWVV
jgi:hypothetical protein